MERVDLGEECDYHFVSSVLELAIEQWNIAVERLRVMLEDPQHLLQELQQATLCQAPRPNTLLVTA